MKQTGELLLERKAQFRINWIKKEIVIYYIVRFHLNRNDQYTIEYEVEEGPMTGSIFIQKDNVKEFYPVERY